VSRKIKLLISTLVVAALLTVVSTAVVMAQDEQVLQDCEQLKQQTQQQLQSQDCEQLQQQTQQQLQSQECEQLQQQNGKPGSLN
jgi:hypothetical protein